MVTPGPFSWMVYLSARHSLSGLVTVILVAWDGGEPGPETVCGYGETAYISLVKFLWIRYDPFRMA